MAGLLDAHQRMETGALSPVIQAAIIAYGFVFLHPFEDGNGRIHRFLIHNVLARRRFTPDGLMFPVSAVMLKHLADYDASLEAFSRSLLPLVDWRLNTDGEMTVHNETALWYRYIDLTPQAEALFGFVDLTVRTELADELAFLAHYDQTKAEIQGIIDMPDRLIDLFIKCCRQNHGRLSERKQASYFAFLSDQEVEQLEHAVRSGFRDLKTDDAGT